MTKILITGGAGYVGSILVHKLFQAESRYITINKYAAHGLGNAFYGECWRLSYYRF